MAKIVLTSIFLIATFWFHGAHGYELGTHSRISKQIYIRSDLFESPQLLSDLGLRSDQNLSTSYYDVHQSEIRQRETQDAFVLADDVGVFPEINEAGNVGISIELQGLYPQTAVGWMMRGAIREDDHTNYIICNYEAPNPQGDDPYGEISRVLNHFYDPYFKRKLEVPLSDTETLVDWALGRTVGRSGERRHDIRPAENRTGDAREI